MSELVIYAISHEDGPARVAAHLDGDLIRERGYSLRDLGEYDDEFRDYLKAAVSDWLTREGYDTYLTLPRLDGAPVFTLTTLMTFIGENRPGPTLTAWGITDLAVEIIEEAEPPRWSWDDTLLDEDAIESATEPEDA